MMRRDDYSYTRHPAPSGGSRRPLFFIPYPGRWGMFTAFRGGGEYPIPSGPRIRLGAQAAGEWLRMRRPPCQGPFVWQKAASPRAPRLWAIAAAATMRPGEWHVLHASCLMTTLLFTHPACLAHDPGPYHPEQPA